MQKCRRPTENCLPIYFDCKNHITATRPHWLGNISAGKQTWCWNGLLLKWKHFNSIHFCHWNAIESGHWILGWITLREVHIELQMCNWGWCSTTSVFRHSYCFLGSLLEGRKTKRRQKVLQAQFEEYSITSFYIMSRCHCMAVFTGCC